MLVTDKELESCKHANGLLAMLRRILRSAWNVVRLLGLVQPLLCPETTAYSIADTGPFMKPRKPEEIWLRWATVLVSQAFPDWLKDMEKSIDDPAGRMLMFSALHLSKKSVKRSDMDPTLNMGVPEEGLNRRFLPYEHWKKYPNLCGGTFLKAEFLKHAWCSGDGLPYHAPHTLLQSENYAGVTYDKLSSKLEKACEELPADLGAQLDEFGVKELEWLAIYISIEDWHAGTRSDERQKSEPHSETGMEVLAHQLGFAQVSDDFLKILATPVLSTAAFCTLAYNQSIFAMSLVLDNLWAICMGQECSNHRIGNIQGINVDYDENGTEIGLPNYDRDVEQLWQESCHRAGNLAYRNHEDLERQFTYMGHSMEFVRSSLAKWVETAGTISEDVWSPRISSGDLSNDGFEFQGSNDLGLCLSENQYYLPEYAKVRLLLELQTYFQGRIPSTGFSPIKQEAVVLCILSFPAVSIDLINLKTSYDSQRVQEWTLRVQAQCAPQEAYLKVHISRPRDGTLFNVSARLYCEDDVFSWKKWRDGFCHRIISSQRSNPKMSIFQSAQDISSISHWCSAKIWTGWMPHRENLCNFKDLRKILPYILERGVSDSMKRTVELYSRAVIHGDNPQELYSLGNLFHYGGVRTDRDWTRTDVLYRRAACVHNYAPAMHSLADLQRSWTRVVFLSE